MPLDSKKLITLHLTGILIIAFLATVSLWIYGLPDPEDALRHFQFASSIYDSLSEGNLFIQGEPRVNQGYGGVALRFYPPFTYYLLASAYFVTHSWYDAAFLFFWLVMAVSGAGAYFLARQWLSANFAFLAGVLYTIDSFHNAQIQLSYAYAEFVAGGLLTFCFLFATRTARGGKPEDIAGLALSFCLLLLTHIPIAIIGSFCLLLFCACHLNRKNFQIQALKLAAAVMLGALGASFHWIRIFNESQWINHSSAKFLTDGFYNYQNHFVDVRATMFPGDLIFMNFLIFLAPSILILFLRRKTNKLPSLTPFVVVMLFSLFMATSFSNFIWENIAVLQKIQFPWRWLTISAIGVAILTAAGAKALETILKGRKFVLILWVTVCLLANSGFTAAYIIGANLMDTEYFLVSREKFNLEVDAKAVKPHSDFWQTTWAKESAFAIKDKVLADDREVKILKWDGFDKQFSVSAGNPSQVRIAQFYYPYWQAKVNGVNAQVSKSEDGALTVSLPEESALVDIQMVEPFVNKFFIAVSIVAWLSIIALFLLNRRHDDGNFQLAHSH